MIEMQIENERVERMRSQQLGADWIQAIAGGAFERLGQLCQPEVVSRMLTPKRVLTLENAAALVAKYREWFGDCTDLQLEGSRVERVGERLGIFYRFLLREDGDWHRIEQQLYCKLKNGQVEQLNLLCSGFQLVGTSDEATLLAGAQVPVGDAFLDFHTEASGAGASCALLTPAIKARLREMQSAQVLEVRVDDPSAKGDIEAWCRLSGNELLKVIDDEGPVLRFFVKKK